MNIFHLIILMVILSKPIENTQQNGTIESLSHYKDQENLEERDKTSIRQCYKCGSSYECGRERHAAINTNCPNESDKCYTMNDKGMVQRGCLEDDKMNCVAPNCKVCDGNLCNFEIFSFVTSCFECESKTKDSPNCTQDTKFGNIPVHSCDFILNNSCYMYYDKAKDDFMRGCSDQSEDFKNGCLAHPEECVICETDNCNTKPFQRASQLSCVQCLEDDPFCAHKQLVNPKLTLCKNLVKFYEKEKCYQYTDPYVGVRYGCKVDDAENLENKHFYECSDPNCNFVTFAYEKCVQCNKKINATCKPAPAPMTPIFCSQPNTFGSLGCYSRIDESGILHRGCTSDLPMSVLRDCMDPKNTKCYFCSGSTCDRMTINEAVRGRFSVVIEVFFFVIFFIKNLK